MNIVVLGAGAIGGYIGGRLVEAGFPISFLVRENRAKKLHKNGIKIKSVHGDFTSRDINIYTKSESVPPSDIVIVSVKGYHLQNIVPQLKVLVNQGAKVLPFLNGMEHIETLSRELGSENVLGGLVFTFSTLDQEGTIVQASELHDHIIGPLHPSQNELCNELVNMMKHAKLNVTNHNDILYELWKKYMFITALSGITTASRLPIGKVREVPETLQMYQNILEEMQSLANAYDINLGEQEVRGFMDQIEEFPEEATSSMHKDLQKRLEIEIDHLHGGALRMAKKKKITLPVIQSIYALLKPYEKGTTD